MTGTKILKPMRPRRSTRGWLLTGVGVAIMLIGASPSSVGGVASRTTISRVGPVHHVGQWIVDNEDRVVITHGFDILWKTAPYYPPAFSAKDAQFLVSQGFTGARIGFLWVGVEPEPGSYDTSYVKHIARLNALLSRYGIRTLVDFHQDDYSASYGGDGAPAWASIGSSAEDAFENLWNDQVVNGTGLIQHFAKVWQIAATALRGAPNLVGFDIFNEPYAGTSTGCALFSPCPSFEEGQLASFYRTMIAAIRKVDGHTLVFYEPVPQLTGAATSLPAPIDNDPDLGFTFHYYDRSCDLTANPSTHAAQAAQDAKCNPAEQAALKAGITYAARAGAAVDLGEFGDSENYTDDANMVDLATEDFLSWTYWEYYKTKASTSPGLLIDDNKAGSTTNVRAGLLNALVVPYPEEIAGTPGTYTLDRADWVMHLRYSTASVDPKMACTGAATEVFVPRRDYPHGYRVRVTGGRVVSPPTWPWVEVVANRGARQVSLTVSQAKGSTTQVATSAIDPRAPVPTCP